MKYADLDDKAKERARDKWREYTMHDQWWDHIYDDAVECAKLLGIEVAQEKKKSKAGREYTETEIWFSGFWSQGDGCCFSGNVKLSALAGAIERIKAHTSDEDLIGLATLAESIHTQATVKMVMQRLDMERDDSDDIELDYTFNIEGKDRYYSTKVGSVDSQYEFLEDDLNNLVESFATWIYEQLEAEHDYQNSDVAIAETIEANDAEFDEEGCEA